MRWVSNLPDQEHTPYQRLAEQPHIKDIVGYFRPSDYGLLVGTGFGGPGAYYLWGNLLVIVERYKPTHHPRYLSKSLVVQFPFFLAIGFYMASVRSIERFWGFTENEREHKRWIAEGKDQIVPQKLGWQDDNW